MKRFLSLTVCFVLTAVLLLSSVSTAVAETITLTAGVYNVGKDIPAGEYEILCTEASDAYNDYLDLMKSLSGDDESLQALWNLYGGLVDEPTVTVTIRGTSGEKKKSFELEKNAKKVITLENDYSIKIEDGTCTLELKKELASSANSSVTDRSSSSSDEWTCPNCGNSATGNFCNNCGTARPEDSESVPVSSENDDIIGTWHAVQVIYNGVTVDIAGTGMYVTMQLNANGSVTISSNDSEEEGTWTRNANTIVLTTDDSGTVNCTYEDEKITLKEQGNEIIFSKDLTTTTSTSLPSPITAASEDQFFGTWNMSRVAAQGIVLTPVEMAAMGSNEDITLTISKGKARADIITNGRSDYNEFTTTFSNGKLQLKSKYNSVALSLILTDSGEISTTSTSDGVTRQIYFTKEGAETQAPAEISSSSEVPQESSSPTESAEPSNQQDVTAVPDSFSTLADLGLEQGRIVDNGTINNTITWELDSNGLLTFKGEGKIRNNNAWRSQSSKVKTVVVFPGITAIGNDVFRSHSNLEQAYIANTVTEIGDSVFAYDQELKSIVLPGSVQKFGEYIFMYGGLETCTLQEGITIIPDNMFRDAEELVTIQLPNTLTEIDEGAFAYCKSLSSITIPGSVVKIEEYAFMYSSLSECIFNEGITSIGENAFRDAEDLETIALPSTLESIGESAFAYCKSLKSVIIPGSTKSIGEYAFMYTGIKDCVIEEGVTEIGENAFRDAESLRTLTLPASITKIGDGAFAYTKVKTINYCGSQSMWSSVSMSKSSGLKDARVTFDYKYESTIPISESNEKTSSKPTEAPTEEIVNNSTTQDDTGLNEPVIPDEYQNGNVIDTGSIGNSISWKYYDNGLLVFSGQGKLKADSSLRSLRSKAKYIFIESGITSIGDQMFRSFEALQGIYIPDTVTELGDKAFYSCSDLEEVTIPGSIKKMGSFIFYDSGVKKITILDGVTEIDDQQFRGAESLQSIRLPNTLKKIGSKAFYNCSDLSEITIPGSVEEIGKFAFYDSGITVCRVENGVTTIESESFRGAGDLEKVILPETVVSIESKAFYSCGIREVVLPKSLQEIADYAFYGNKLKTVNYCGSKTDWLSIEMGRNSEFDKANIVCDYVRQETDGTTSSESVDSSVTDKTSEATSTPTVTNSPAKETPTPTKPAGVTFSSDGLIYTLTDDNALIITGCEKSASSINISSTVKGYDVIGIGEGAFENNSSLKDIYIWADIESIGNSAFKNCTALKDITIPSSLDTLGVSAFEGCTSLKAVYMFGSPEEIGDYCFKGCTKLEDITIPSSVDRIGISAFEGCEKLKYAYIFGSVKTIDEKAFYNCVKLDEITIPSSNKIIGKSAFENCSNLSNVYFFGGETIAEAAFRNCSSLNDISIPSGMKTIEKYAFENCTDLEDVIIWSRNTKIDSTAFHNCPFKP